MNQIKLNIGLDIENSTEKVSIKKIFNLLDFFFGADNIKEFYVTTNNGSSYETGEKTVCVLTQSLHKVESVKTAIQIMANQLRQDSIAAKINGEGFLIFSGSEQKFEFEDKYFIDDFRN